MPHFLCLFLIIHMSNFLFCLIYFISDNSDYFFSNSAPHGLQETAFFANGLFSIYEGQENSQGI